MSRWTIAAFDGAVALFYGYEATRPGFEVFDAICLGVFAFFCGCSLTQAITESQ